MRGEITWEQKLCPKCRRLVMVRDWDGWTETHDCEPACRACGHERHNHRPVCAGEPEYPYICKQDCMRFVSPVDCPWCDGTEWLPDQYVGTPYAGRWRCVCHDHFDTMSKESRERSKAIVSMLASPQMTFEL